MNPPVIKSPAELGQIMLDNYSKEEIVSGYALGMDASLAEIGDQALRWGDINEDGSLN